MIITKPRGRRPYVLHDERDKPDAEQSRFILEDLRESDRVEVMDAMQFNIDGGVQGFGGAARKVYRTLKAGLRGWENVRDEDGAEVRFKSDADGRPTDETLALLPWPAKEEIAGEILDATTPTEGDVEK